MAEHKESRGAHKFFRMPIGRQVAEIVFGVPAPLPKKKILKAAIKSKLSPEVLRVRSLAPIRILRPIPADKTLLG